MRCGSPRIRPFRVARICDVKQPHPSRLQYSTRLIPPTLLTFSTLTRLRREHRLRRSDTSRSILLRPSRWPHDTRGMPAMNNEPRGRCQQALSFRPTAWRRLRLRSEDFLKRGFDGRSERLGLTPGAGACVLAGQHFESVNWMVDGFRCGGPCAASAARAARCGCRRAKSPGEPARPLRARDAPRPS